MKVDLVVEGYTIHDSKILLIHHAKRNLWFPVGGHIDSNETPDEALIREAKEEANIDIEILNQSGIPLEGNVKQNLANPFYVNVHNVGDHDHCCLFYVCKILNPDEVQINHESKDFGWFSREDLEKDVVPLDVKHQGNLALDLFEKLTK